MLQKFRKYKNAFESAVQTHDEADSIGGWSDIVKQDTDLLKMVIEMVDNQDNPTGRKVAVMLCKHPKESIRYLANLVMKGEKFEVEDRTTISL